MSKKQGKSQAQKKAAQIVEQQKDPMLRALQKKVRNINKKLTQISELEVKKDLKPQQEQKINKKPLLERQKQKYQEMIQVYKEIAIENKQILRKSQLTQLQDLSAIIAVKEYSVDIGAQHNQSVDKLLKVLTNSSSPDLSLSQRINEIKEAIVSTANNPKLKKAVKDYVDANQNQKKVNVESISDEPEPLSPRSEQQRQAQLKQLQQQQQKNQSAKKLEQPLPPQVTQEKPPAESVVQTVTQSKPVEKSQDQQQKPSEQQKLELNQAEKTQEVKDQTVKPESPNQRRNQKREYKGNNRGNYRGRPKGEEQRKNYKKPSFKPKYQEKNKTQEAQKRDSSLSSSNSDSEPKARQFKRQQIKELINDGFIVVGKPKIKARDQREYHEHQHGNKQHHKPHTKKNY